jgi:acetyl esterase
MKRFSLFVPLLAFASFPQVSRTSAEEPAGYFRTVPPTQRAALEPALKASLAELSRATPIEKMTPAEARRVTEERIAKIPKLHEAVGRVDDRSIPGPASKIPVRIYTPEGKGPLPILLYIHGGGWTVGSLDTHDDLCRSLCHRGGCVVVSVGYRLAPETKFPGPLEDCYAALQWCAAHAADLDGDGKRLAVAGDSAGGHLSACLALYARDNKGPPLVCQVLVYPVINHAFDTASYHQNATGYGLTRDRMIYYWNNYLRSPEDADNAHACPLRARDLRGLPPALIVTAEFDPLRDDGEAYAARLQRSGVSVECVRYLDMNHGFLQFGAVYRQSKHGLDLIAAALKKAFRS